MRELIAGDNSAAMLEVAEKHRLAPHLPAQLINTSAFHIDLPDNAVDLAACMRFYHHFSHREDRDQLLDELKRVSRQFIALSLWVDGNLAAVRRLRRTPIEIRHGYGGRICRRREEVEAEFADAGLNIVRSYDVWPRIQMWRTYLLEIR